MTTFVTGFFQLLPTWHPNYESKFEEYRIASEDLLKQDIRLVFFGDDTMASQVLKVRKTHGLLSKTFIVPTQLTELFLYKQKSIIEEIYTYGSDDSTFTRNSRFNTNYLITILSKIHLLERAYKYNPFDSQYFVWIDFGYFRHRKTYPQSYCLLSPTVFSEIDASMGGTLFRIGSTSAPAGREGEPHVFYKKYNQSVAGCLFGGSVSAISAVSAKFNEEIDWLLENKINTCEENIFGRLIHLYPSLFDVFVTKYTTALNNFAFQTCSFEYCVFLICKFCFHGNNHAELSSCLRILDAVKRGAFKTDMANLYNYICISAYYIDRVLYSKYKAEALLYFDTNKISIEPRILKNLSF